MAGKLGVIPGGKRSEESKVFSPEEDLENFRKIIQSLMADAQLTWAEIWDSLMGVVTDGSGILSDVQKGPKPKCGWAEYLEKLWLLKHYLDYTRRFAAEDM
ncbi:MAG: hypothetical protein WC405_18590 [Syntrophales bacterium]